MAGDGKDESVRGGRRSWLPAIYIYIYNHPGVDRTTFVGVFFFLKKLRVFDIPFIL